MGTDQRRMIVKLVDKLSAEQRSALERVSAELAERGAREAREREEEFFERCRAKLDLEEVLDSE